MKFEKVIDGIVKYINIEVYSGMNDWQEVLARIAVSRFVSNSEKFKTVLMENTFIKTFGILDNEGNVDIEGLANDLKKQIEAKGKITIPLSIFGNFTFTAQDVDKLYQTIIQQ